MPPVGTPRQLLRGSAMSGVGDSQETADGLQNGARNRNRHRLVAP
jgi:hypothetical protein